MIVPLVARRCTDYPGMDVYATGNNIFMGYAPYIVGRGPQASEATLDARGWCKDNSALILTWRYP
jgi:hypothetical protein